MDKGPPILYSGRWVVEMQGQSGKVAVYPALLKLAMFQNYPCGHLGQQPLMEHLLGTGRGSAVETEE